jgi:DNA-directed RNA polymerase specialized sigma24 family protein
MTVKALYQAATGDVAAHQRRIDAHLRRLDPRRQRMLKTRAAGATLRQIAAAENISVGSVQSAIDGALERIRKAIAGEPRYNHTGRR